MRTLCICVVLACMAWAARGAETEGGEARPAPPRGLLKRGLHAKKISTTTPLPQKDISLWKRGGQLSTPNTIYWSVKQDDDYDYTEDKDNDVDVIQDNAYSDEEEDYSEEEGQDDGVEVTEASSETPSTTESKRQVAGGVRPFRSNTDLLETLKRRRAQAAEAKHGHQQAAAPQEAASEAAPAPPASPAKQANFGGKKRFSSASRVESPSTSEDSPPPAAKPSRNRFSRPSPKSLQPEPEAEDQNDAGQTRSARTFSRRGGN